jgi:hypothetical protein
LARTSRALDHHQDKEDFGLERCSWLNKAWHRDGFSNASSDLMTLADWQNHRTVRARVAGAVFYEPKRTYLVIDGDG